MHSIWRVIRYPVFFFLVYLGAILLFDTLTDWQPRGVERLAPVQQPATAPAQITDSVISVVTWNVGYGGLGAEDYSFYHRGDFFWTDLGRARTPRDRLERYVAGQRLTLENVQSDIFLLQEVDSSSRRSYYTNQLDTARSSRPDYAAYYAPNFRSKLVPIPLFQPWDFYGPVESGLVSLSRFRPDSVQRIQLPGQFPWPQRLFHLDRCAMRQLFQTSWGKELAVYNVHLSAFDEDGSLRRAQLDRLRERVLADYAAGRYVIVGGDWNQVPPGFSWFSLNPTVEETQLPRSLAFDFFPEGWLWAYDPSLATVRKSDAPYDAHRSERSIIDLFLCSPGMRLRRIKTINQEFQFSDHQPVYLEVELLR